MFNFLSNLKSFIINKVMQQSNNENDTQPVTSLVIKKSIEEIEQEFINDIRIANNFSFVKEPIQDSSFWKGKGITVSDDDNQCVLHTKTNLVFKMSGEVIGIIDEDFSITLVDELRDNIKEWIEYHSLKVYREDLKIETVEV